MLAYLTSLQLDDAGQVILFAALGTVLYVCVTRAANADVPQRRRKRVYHDDD